MYYHENKEFPEEEYGKTFIASLLLSIMSLEGYEEYTKRSFCNDIRCPVQMELNMHEPGSKKYEEIRKRCRENCLHTAWEFHHWLTERDYIILREKR